MLGVREGAWVRCYAVAWAGTVVSGLELSGLACTARKLLLGIVYDDLAGDVWSREGVIEI